VSGPAPDEQGRALASAASAYVLWGVLPLFLKLLAHLPPLEVTAHRALWTAPAAAAAAAAMGGLAQLKVDRAVLVRLMLAAGLIGINWLIYVWAVANERIVEASLGYFLLPLLNVAIGVAAFGERLTGAQWIAVGLAAAGVLNMAVGVGVIPWVALGLALSFGLYGVVKKTVPVTAPAGLFWEAALLSVPAAGLMIWVGASGGAPFGTGQWDWALLLLTGPISAIPLMLFAYGARRLPLTALGLLQYLAPTLQFVIGLSFGEPFTLGHAVTFGLIWAGLALYTWSGARARRAAADKAVR
jgi:chloramphenicol-sensitive protein RarD